jgi:hypothetical protein
MKYFYTFIFDKILSELIDISCKLTNFDQFVKVVEWCDYVLWITDHKDILYLI